MKEEVLTSKSKVLNDNHTVPEFKCRMIDRPKEEKDLETNSGGSDDALMISTFYR